MCSTHDYAHLVPDPAPVPSYLAGLPAADDALAFALSLVEGESDGWPAPDQPCSDDAECGTTCYEDDGAFVYETTRGGNGYAVEDVQAYCWCEHHGPQAAVGGPRR